MTTELVSGPIAQPCVSSDVGVFLFASILLCIVSCAALLYVSRYLRVAVLGRRLLSVCNGDWAAATRAIANVKP